MRWRYSPQVYVTPGQVREVLEDRKLPPDVRRKAWQYPPLAGEQIQPGAPPTPEYPPHLFPPVNAYHIHLPLTSSPAVAIAAGGSAVLALWPRVPLGATGVVRELGMSTSSFADTRLTTRVNLAPVQPYPGVIGPVGELEEPHQIAVILKPGDEFSVLVENIGAVGITVSVRTYGWWWY